MEQLSIEKQPFSTYPPEDVQFLMKDLSEVVLEDTTENRESLIQQGHHYSETLPTEKLPTKAYLDLFWHTLHELKHEVALCIAIVAEQLLKKHGDNMILVSLARAGTPIGILIRRYILQKYNVTLPHYTISIIRDRGIDEKAILHILQTHPGMHIQFIDGWTGKGAISVELTMACEDFFRKYGYKLDDTLAVLADPGYCTTLYGTREDFLIPSACLNSTVTGLVSRTVLNDQFIGPNDFHGAKFYKEWRSEDVSLEFIKQIESEFHSVAKEALFIANDRLTQVSRANFQGKEDVLKIQKEFAIDNIHFVKPGVGETTRVLLRRVPWKILIKDFTNPYIHHILLLAKEKEIEVIAYPNMSYTACGLIKKIGGSTR